MSDFEIRTLGVDEHRAASDLFRGTVHFPPADDTEWERTARTYQPGGTLGAFGPELVGTAKAFDAELTVPGGARLPMAGVTGVGVRADRTRRGILRALMTAQLEDFAGRGVVFANLLASEGTIYGRFGYGLATRCRTYSVDRHRARLRPEVPAGGELELLEIDRAFEVCPGIYERLRRRPGGMTRPEVLWRLYENQARRGTQPMKTVVHHGPDGPDGFVRYFVGGGHDQPKRLEVTDLSAGSPAAFAGLWRFLLGVDLVDRVVAEERALDEPIELILADHRHATVERVADEHWIRLVDVPKALAAREYGHAAPVVLEVVDPLLPGNSGAYRITPDGAERTDGPAALRLDVTSLAMVYLGTWRVSALADAGRVEVRDPAAPAAADALFGTRVASWSGTYF
ncbi:GNAT family N-acetyltransferase [Amycolatopsis balhimycina DSM 5908]|uniref:GNAT family N-acetyltransferase n=1 Tax=Amycolatopsis balhimycina DSM 5908 TaxID=1081091 RepID=A0A428W332_AMYBA|nr:GNAT family N-acetyltransferase [Amycolatopsis balhimycina]RSM37482.1 GNAT family N-acetyltransferase [Amycolatopsis balhimycina DSM 5908]